MSLWRQPISVVFRLLAGLLLLTQGGCMSALTTAAMREALRETVDSLAVVAADPGQDADVSATRATDATAHESPPLISEPRPPSLDESVDRAVARLKGVGELDAPTQATLLSILEKTSPEDWPAAINAFAASLEAYRPPPPHKPKQDAEKKPAVSKEPPAVARAKPEAPPEFPATGPSDGAPSSEPAATAVVFEPSAESRTPATVEQPAEMTLVFPGMAITPEPTRLTVLEAAWPVDVRPDESVDDELVFAAGTTLQPSVAQEPMTFPEPPVTPEPQVAAAPPQPLEPPVTMETPVVVEQPAATTPDMPDPPALTVRNASFVSRVRGWGVVERFPEAVFRPGQDVIVYFELDPLTARRSSSGHTTSVDTDFRLLDSEGRQIGEWDFEPIDDTCPAPRRDYFARYFIRIPEEATPGSYRLELMVTDLVAGMSSRTHLDLEVRP
jgi:hypothetical protein